MDTDNVPGTGGAEDSYYSGETPSYRTAGQPLDNITELAAIRGYTIDVREVIKQAVCVRPFSVTDTKRALNLNTIRPQQAGQLVSALSGALDIENAQRIIAARPTGGWSDIEAFVAEPAIASISPELRQFDRLGFVTTHIEVFTQISYREEMIVMKFQFETREGQPVRLLSRARVE